jgi:hypothetical protein
MFIVIIRYLPYEFAKAPRTQRLVTLVTDWLGTFEKALTFLEIELWIYQVIWKIPEELRAE